MNKKYKLSDCPKCKRCGINSIFAFMPGIKDQKGGWDYCVRCWKIIDKKRYEQMVSGEK